MKRFSLGLRAKHFWTPSPISNNSSGDEIFIGVADGKIAALEKWRPRYRADCQKFYDVSGDLLIPGLINGHTHLAMSLFRGFNDDLSFLQWLHEWIWPLEEKLLDEEFVTAGTELSALESIRFGTTTVADMYLYSNTVASVLDRAGLRGFVAQHYTVDLSVEEKKWFKSKSPAADSSEIFSRRLVEHHQLQDKWKNHPRVFSALGPHAPYSVSDPLMIWIREQAIRDGQRIFMHVSETATEVADSIRNFGMTPVARLAKLGLLNVPFTLIHGTHLSDSDIQILANQRIPVIYNPDSNMKLGSGIAPIPRLLKAGVVVGLGTDGAASNNDLSLFGAMETGIKAQKNLEAGLGGMNASQMLNMATLGGATALGLGSELGSLEVGKKADFVVIDTSEPHFQPFHSIPSQLVYATSGMEVKSVWVDGRPLMIDRKFKTLDVEKVFKKVRKQKKRILDQIQKIKNKRN